MANTPSPSTARSVSELSSSLSSSPLSRICASPRERTSDTFAPPAPRFSALSDKRVSATSRNGRNASRPRKLQRRMPAARMTVSTTRPESIEVRTPASPPSSFYSSTAAASTSTSAHSLPDRASLDALVRSLVASPPQPLTPRTPAWTRPPPKSDLSPQTPTILGRRRGVSRPQIFLCNIHGRCGSDYGIAERCCVEKVIATGGEVLDRLVPGGFMYALPPLLENPLRSGERIHLGGHISVLAEPRFHSQIHRCRDDRENEDVDSLRIREHHNWCDGDGKEVELWSGKGGRTRRKPRKWFTRGRSSQDDDEQSSRACGH